MSSMLVLALFLALAEPGSTTEAEPTAEALLQAAEAPRRAIEEGRLRLRMTIERQGKPAQVSILDQYVRGDDRLFVFAEGWQAGRKMLTLGDRTWLIVPGSKKAIPVSPREGSLGGIAFADPARLRLAEQFDATLAAEREVVEGTDCFVLDLVARSPATPYARARLWTAAEDRLPRKLRLTLPSGKDATEVLFRSYDRTGARPWLQEMVLRDLLDRRGSATTLEFLSHEAGALDPALFSIPRKP